MKYREENKDEEMKIEEPRLSKKRTYAMMQKDFKPQSSELLLSPSEDFPKRKRAKSF